MPGGLTAGQLVDDRYALEDSLDDDVSLWRAHDRGLGRTVHLQEIEVDAEHRQDALMAARRAIRVDSPGAVHVWDAFLDGERLVIVTEPVSARTLAAVVGRKGALPAKRVAAIGLDLLDALAAAHGHGVVHGAVSAEAVLVPDRGPARLTGFGLPRDISAETGAELEAEADVQALADTLTFAAGSHASELGDLDGTIDELRTQLLTVAGVFPDASYDATETARRRGRRERRRGEVPAPPADTDTEAEAQDGPEPEPAEAADEDHDWASVVENAWQDWAPDDVEASDVWLPGSEQDTVVTWPDGNTAHYASAQPLAAPAGDGGVDGAEPDTTAVSELAPDAARGEAEEPARVYRSTPSWPPPEVKKSKFVVVLISLVIAVMVILLITNGRRFGKASRTQTTVSAQQRPVLGTDPSAVPSNWVAYRHPSVDFGISYPPGWTVKEEGTVVTISDPVTRASLRIDYSSPPGQDFEQTWLDLERGFYAQHPTDYKRLQLSPANYLGHPAALWEFTYQDGLNPVHAVDLGFLTKKYRFALHFQAAAGGWEQQLAVFRGFLGSVRAPK